MTFETFKYQITILSSVFPNRRIDPEVYFEFWKDLDDERFAWAISNFIKNTPVLYPDTNIIALIRDYAKERKPFGQGIPSA